METYGPDADVFRPERWLEAKGEKLKRMTTINDLVFASGRFRCLGYPLALMELNKIFVQVLCRFLEPHCPSKMGVVSTTS